MGSRWSTRRATLEDRRSIMALSNAAVGEDDYVLMMLDDLIKTAATFIALDDGKVIGMMTYHDQLDGTGWISSARTHPDYRRRGVASSIVHALERYGSERGARALRLWTEETNELGKAAFLGIGFMEVGKFTRFTAPEGKTDLGLDVEKISYSERLWESIEASPIMRRSRMYVNHGFGFIRLDQSVLRRLTDQSFVYGWNDTIAVLTEFMFAGVETLEGQILTGEVAEGLSELRGVAKDFGIKQVHTFPPRYDDLVAAAQQTGYKLMEWGHEAILCEKPI